jgi:hypothetical protein
VRITGVIEMALSVEIPEEPISKPLSTAIRCEALGQRYGERGSEIDSKQ